MKNAFYKLINDANNSYLVHTDDLENCITDLEDFIKKRILDNADLKTSGDYLKIQRDEDISKDITVDTIRKMNNFVHSSSVISGKKTIIIVDAEHMNKNAANAILKTLEEPPSYCYIFLITLNPTSLLETIRSRCFELKILYNKNTISLINQDYIKLALENSSSTDENKTLREFQKKDIRIWQDFTNTALTILYKFIQKRVGINQKFTTYENQLYEQYSSKTNLELNRKYAKIEKSINNVKEFDLDHKSNFLLILNILKH